ncbi:MAG: outer membrane lipoprotein-sorting protein [Desulfobacterales bacterium]|jgi:outer membrane lipoprotein-sorting protein
MKRLAIAGILVFWVLAFPSFAIDGTELLKTIDANLNPESFEMYRKLINVEPNGREKEFILYSVKKGKDKIASVFLSPASEKGRATLRVGENMWLFIPNVGKPIRITSLQSITGGIFNNADIMRLNYTQEYNCEKVEKVEGLYLLHLKAKTRSVAYDKVRMWADDQKLLPTKIECYAASGILLKTLYFKEIKAFGDKIVRPSVIETDSPLHKGYKSIMIFARVKAMKINDEVFTLAFMSNLESLR